MLDTNCPQCGAALQFRSADLVAKVCAYCHSTVVRRGDVLENVGKAAEVPDDVSPLQLGVRGRDGDKRFEVVGRVRWRWADGAWNEWCCLFDSGGYAWLGEASGRWMLLEEVNTSAWSGGVVAALRAGRTVVPGDTATLGEIDYSVNDVQAVECIGAEGELPFPTPIGTKGISVDLQRPDGRAASIQTENGEVSAYVGRYVTLAEIRAAGPPSVRWLAAAEVRGVTATTRPLTCPNCGGQVALRAAGSTVSLVCEHCGSTLDTTSGELQVIAKAAAAMRAPEIPLGTRGTLDDVAWEVIGYQERSDGEVEWAEYLLFNPYEGYAFLADDGRRFSLGRMLAALPEADWRGLQHDGDRFRRFGDTYPVRTRFVVGEFYWRARVGEAVDETDYVTPGIMLSCEESGAERTWTRLEMQDWGVAERAFGLAPRTRDYAGTPAPHEPSPYAAAWRDARVLAALALAACLVIAIGTAFSTRVLQQQLSVPADERTHTQVLGPITVTGGREKVKIAAAASGLDNQWLDLDYALVNRATQESFDAYAASESYHGRDSDGAWSEGDSAPATGLASIPQGTYDLVVDAAAHRWTDPKASTVTGIFGSGDAAPVDAAIPVTVTVDRGGGFAGPFFLALVAIGLWPLIAWARHRSFEQRRLAPVTTDDDEDDDE